LTGGLVRERDRQDLTRPRIAPLQQQRDAPGQHAGLPRSGARDDQQRGAAVSDGFELRGIQSGQQLLAAGGARVGGCGDNEGGVGHGPSSLGGRTDSGRSGTRARSACDNLRMRTILNIIWVVFAGFGLFLGYVLAGVLLCIPVVTIPWAIASFRIARYSL